MSLRAVRGLLFGSLVVGLTTVGCGDGDGNDNDGKGGMDAGSDAGADAGGKLDSGADGTVTGDVVTCGGETCTGGMLGSNKVTACCATGDVCGLNAGDVPESPFQGCLPKNVFPDAPTSAHCGAFWDQAEPDLKAEHLLQGKTNADIHSNGGFDIGNALVGNLTFNGCCVPSGECGVRLTEPINFPGINLELGCMSLSALQMATGGGGGTPSGRPAPTLVPFCNPTSGAVMCPAKLGPICDRVKMSMPNFQCTAATDTPDWICQMLQLPTADGNIPAPACMAGLPKYARGCGAPTGTNCVANVPATVFGCEDVTAGKSVPTVPSFVCGCGGPTAPEGVNCIPNVPPSVCGAGTANDAELVKMAPKFACGCGVDKNDTDPTDFPPCLPYTAEATCGEAAPSTAVLARVPEFICGCETNNPAAVLQTTCMRGVDMSVCGTKETEIDNKGTPDNPSDDCLKGVPEYARGCGPEGEPAASPAAARVCLRHAEQLFGCVNTQVDNKNTETPADDCLIGVPEYLIGCGEAAVTGTPNCLPFAAAAFGCVDVTTPPRAVFEHICGCGNNPTDIAQAFPAYPCLSRVATDICGATPVLVTAQAIGVGNNLSGCGDGMTSGASPCVKNVPNTVFGAQAVCPLCQAPTPTCADTNADNIGDSCQP